MCGHADGIFTAHDHPGVRVWFRPGRPGWMLRFSQGGATMGNGHVLIKLKLADKNGPEAWWSALLQEPAQ